MSINPKWKWNKERFINDCMNMVINKEELDKNIIFKNYFSSIDVIFIEKERKEIFSKVFDNFNLSKEYKDKFFENISSKILFYIQYFAGSPTLEYARSINYFNITTFIAATLNKELSAHRNGYGLIDIIKKEI